MFEYQAACIKKITFRVGRHGPKASNIRGSFFTVTLYVEKKDQFAKIPCKLQATTSKSSNDTFPSLSSSIFFIVISIKSLQSYFGSQWHLEVNYYLYTFISVILKSLKLDNVALLQQENNVTSDILRNTKLKKVHRSALILYLVIQYSQGKGA